jgi:ATP-dependent DNA helicase RecQ
MTDDFERAALDLLRRLTADSGSTFRDGQLEAIRTVVERRGRALVIQRTGWGKSAVYLVATALLRAAGSGPTVIVSPLLALMRNQLEMADRLGLHSVSVNSTNKDSWSEAFAAIEANELDLLLISPERFNNDEFRRDALPHLLRRLGMLVIDEVHCISDWGHDFRPDYRRLGQIVADLPPNVPVLGTTATANDRVIRDAREQLGADLAVYRGSLERDSLALQVIEMPNVAQRMAWLAATIPRLAGSGIVYCLTIHDAERVAAWLRTEGIVARAYTGPMDHEARIAIEEALSAGRLKAVVATSALAMGYDNPHIEFVIHFQMPGSPIAYYQQVGRAGRAVARSFGVGLSGWEDRDIQDWFINTAFPTETQTTAILYTLQEQPGCSVSALEATVNLKRSRLVAALKILDAEGAVYRQGSSWFRSAQAWRYPTERIAAVTAARRAEQEAMATFVTTDGCLMEFLRRQLDDPAAGRCGRCANCAGPIFPADVDTAATQRALRHLRLQPLVIEPRKIPPAGVDLGVDLRNHRFEPGRALTRWGDPGLAELVRRGKYEDGRFDDELVAATVELVNEWAPTPSPEWATLVPSTTGGEALADFAARLAAALDLPLVEAVERVRPGQPQKTMENSAQQARNVAGAFAVGGVRPGPVLLVDDMVDSRWTFSVIAALLRGAGAGPVYPVALANTSGSGDDGQ